MILFFFWGNRGYHFNIYYDMDMIESFPQLEIEKQVSVIDNNNSYRKEKYLFLPNKLRIYSRIISYHIIK